MENYFDGLKVVIRVHIQYGVVLVVKLAVGFGTGVVAFDQVFEIIKMAFGVVVRVHRHETAVLQKARVDAPTCARKLARDPKDHIVFKPAVALVGCQVVDGCG